MKYDDAILYTKKELQKYTNVSSDLKSWIKKRLEDHYKEKLKKEQDDYREYFVLDELLTLLGKIEKQNPKNAKAFVERELKRESYHKELRDIAAEVRRTKITKSNADKIRKKIDALEKKVEKEDPEYLKIIQVPAARIRSMLSHKLYGLEDMHVHIR